MSIRHAPGSHRYALFHRRAYVLSLSADCGSRRFPATCLDFCDRGDLRRPATAKTAAPRNWKPHYCVSVVRDTPGRALPHLQLSIIEA